MERILYPVPNRLLRLTREIYVVDPRVFSRAGQIRPARKRHLTGLLIFHGPGRVCQFENLTGRADARGLRISRAGPGFGQ